MSKDIKLVGIDPGKSAGAMAILVDGELITEKLDAVTYTALNEQMEEQSPNDDYDVLCLVEDAVVLFSSPKLIKSTSLLARHCGALDCCLELSGIPQYPKVKPNIWMNKIFPERPKGSGDVIKKARKRYIRDVAQKRFPNTKIPIYAGDAVGVLMYLMKERGVL